MSGFKSKTEFCEVMDRTFEIMSTDPEMGPKLRDAETPQRFEFPDVDAVANVTFADGRDPNVNLVWKWSDDVDWTPDVEMTMDSDVANRYFSTSNCARSRRKRRNGVDGRAGRRIDGNGARCARLLGYL